MSILFLSVTRVIMPCRTKLFRDLKNKSGYNVNKTEWKCPQKNGTCMYHAECIKVTPDSHGTRLPGMIVPTQSVTKLSGTAATLCEVKDPLLGVCFCLATLSPGLLKDHWAIKLSCKQKSHQNGSKLPS